MHEHLLVFATFVDHWIDRPGKCLPSGLASHHSKGFADGHQLTECSFTRAGLFQLAREQTVRHRDDIHVPGLALIVTRLTLAHAEFLFPVPVKVLLARPAITFHQQDPVHFPGRSIRHQYLACLLVAALVPEDHRADFVVDFRSSSPTPLSCRITSNPIE